MDQLLSKLLFIAALLSLAAAALLLFNGFIEYLQLGAWRSPSLLGVGYETGLLKARWFLAYTQSWWIPDLLAKIPVYAALLTFGPLLWWCSNRLGGR